MVTTAVTSSNIRRIGHDGDDMLILFNSGIAYRYRGVPKIVYELAIEAESVGQFFHHHIKGKLTYSKLERNPFDAPAQTEELAPTVQA